MTQKTDDLRIEKTMQLLPPIAWYFGGSVALNVFNSEEDLKWLKIFSLNICLDICHFGMCLAGNFVSKYNFEELFELTNHIHLADSVGIDGEGIQIGQGDSINRYFLKRSLASSHTKVLEVWQGHLNSYKGFHEAIKYSLDLIKYE